MVGRTLAQYRIVEKVGAGGMGVVYRARDTRLDRTVAIKFIGEQLGGGEIARARLLREARTASALNHPNICTIYDVGEADGQSYIAMEFVEGRPLNALIPPGGLPIATAIRYGIQIADALVHAQERDVVHRDLKSANVIILPENRVKVLDFGLAKRLPQGDAEPTRTDHALTEAGAVVGTVHYMAPEVLKGEQADGRSDLWALGVMLHEMAAGELPFQGRTGFEITSAILRETVPPLPARVPAGLRTVIQRSLEKEPGHRYQSAVEVRAALEAVQSGVSGMPAAPVASAPATISRRRWIWALVPAAMLLAGGLLKVHERYAAQPAVPRVSTGGTASKVAEANEYFEKAMLFLKTQSDMSKARPMLERALQLDAHFAEARAWYGFTHLLMFDQGYSNDTSWFFKTEEEIRQALQDDPNCGRAHSTLAALHFYQGRKELVPAELEKALFLNPNDNDAALWLSYYHILNGDYVAAQALLKKVADRDPVFFVPRLNLAEVLRELADTAGAIRIAEKVLEQDPQNYPALGLIATTYQDMGEISQARQVLERMQPQDRKNYVIRIAWATQLALEGKRKPALREMDDDVLKYAAASPFLLSIIAEVYAVLGDAAKALEWLERAVRAGDERSDWFRRDPLLANVRREPRFQQILDSIAFRRQQRPAPRK